MGLTSRLLRILGWGGDRRDVPPAIEFLDRRSGVDGPNLGRRAEDDPEKAEQDTDDAGS